MDAEVPSVVGAKLKALRCEFGLTQQDWAKLLQVNANTVARWERGEIQPRGAHRQKVEQVLAISDDREVKDAIRDSLRSEGGLAAAAGLLGMLFGVLGVVGVGLAVIRPLLRSDSGLLSGVMSFARHGGGRDGPRDD